MTKVSIVTAYHKNRDMTQEWYSNILNTTDKLVQTVIVSAGNVPDIGEIVIPINARIQDGYVYLPENKSFSNSMNEGIKRTWEDSDYIVIIGNDTFPTDKDWLPNMIETQQKTNAAIVGIVPSRPHYSNYAHLLQKTDGHVDYYSMYPAICWLVPRAVFKKVGLFDEQFLIGCYEDNDFCERVNQELPEMPIVVDTRVYMEHKLSQTIGLFNVAEVMAANGERFNKKWNK
jgi:GT2 family glycosyltransferase